MGIGGDMGIRDLCINLSPYLFHLLISIFTLIFAYLLISEIFFYAAIPFNSIGLT
jgi:hypothetical protein